MARKASTLVATLFAATALIMAGCGDDDDNGSTVDAGGDADVGGDGGQTCEERVMEQQPDNDPECTSCLCDNCEMELEDCDNSEDCPELVACAQDECPDNPNDVACVSAACGEFIGGATPAMAVGACTEEHCSDECFGTPDGGTPDGGADGG
ncbi:MAG: hypothetical protein ACOCXM_00110 [Myxococcota bacterium]